MATSDKELLELNLYELRDLFGRLDKSYDRLRTKAITMLIGEVAIVTFLFSGKHGVPTPSIIYGVVFYGIGLLLLVMPFLLFLWIISPDQWIHPVDLDSPKDIKSKFNSGDSYREHLVEEYISAIRANSNKLNFRSRPFVIAMYMLSIAIMIMLLLKYGGGNI